MATTWFVLGAVLGEEAETAEGIQNHFVGLGGLGALAAGTAVEAELVTYTTKRNLPALPEGNPAGVGPA